MSTLSGTTTPARRSLRRAAAVGAGTLLGLTGAFATAGPASAVTQASAESQFSAAGISWTSSGGCTTRSNSTCTSFDGIRQATIDGAKTLKSASGCGLTITGGTEVGHAGGTYSHYNGYKLDFSRTSCLTSWVTGTYTYIGTRSDGAAQYQSGAGNVYADEGNHWDVTFYNCGGC
ncbi:hypothetical protein GCM10023340_07710 [Nocardioides marinquilinus]|uniref:Peptidoglycan-binding protein n=1 Tax=Nocardioides marinquilinus TaxID=1210400 RepID=A0ABP9P9N0_9ACTN